MKLKSIILTSITFLLISCATIYKSDDLKQVTEKHNKIAFLPFETVMKYKKLPKNTTVEQIKEMEEDMGYIFQDQMYTRFLKKGKNFDVDFQDVSKTNALLKKNEINYSNMSSYTKEEIANIIGVDAVVSGKILTSKPMSTGGAIAMEVLFGASGATNKVDINVSLHNGGNSKLLFKYDHTFSGSLGSTPEKLSKTLIKKIEKKFPYKK